MSHTPQRAYRIPDRTGEWLIFADKWKGTLPHSIHQSYGIYDSSSLRRHRSLALHR